MVVVVGVVVAVAASLTTCNVVGKDNGDNLVVVLLLQFGGVTVSGERADASPGFSLLQRRQIFI